MDIPGGVLVGEVDNSWVGDDQWVGRSGED